MGRDLFLLQQLFTAFASSWISVGLLVCLFLVLILRPERIQNRGRFKAACLFLALSTIVPAAQSAALLVPAVLPSSGFGPTGIGFGLFWLVSVTGAVLIGAGVFLGLTSLIPRRSESPVAQPTRHPLE